MAKQKPQPDKPPEPRALNLLASAVELEAAAPEGEPPKLRRFSMTAYTGGPMQLPGWRYPVVVDLQGLQVGRQKRPILLDHTRDVDFVMGQTDAVSVINGELVVAGHVMGESAKAKQVIALNDKGFSWQSSIGARADQVEFVPEGKTSQANGRDFAGPVNIARRATLGEISFVVLGADDNTSAQIAASAQPLEETDMEFAAWIEAQGFSPDALNDAQTKNLRVLYELQAAKPAPTDEPPPNATVQIRAAAIAELDRINAIRKACDGKHPDIEAQAVREGWDGTKTELAVLRASRPAGPAIHAVDRDTFKPAIIEAALCMAAQIPAASIERCYDAQTLEAASTARMRRYTFSRLFHEVIQAAGMYAAPGRLDDQSIETALRASQMLQAAGGFSTISLPGILGNVAHRALLAAYEAVPRVSTLFCATASMTDFKTHTKYRMTATGAFEKVGPGGELKHATLTEETFTNQLDTYGKMIKLTRQQIINDDLGAFLQLPQMLGRSAANAIEKAVFTLLLSNPGGFFAAGNKNLLTGATSVLSIGGLTLGEALYWAQTDANGDPVLVRPSVLLVGTNNKVTAEQLMSDRVVNETTTTDKPKPASNPHAGKFSAVSSPYVNAQGISGSSDTKWWLFANPADVAAMEIGFLNGQQTPTIESGEANFNELGIQWRAYHDFGIAMQDKRAAIQSNGT